MSKNTQNDYRQCLRQQLEIAGPAALEMLAGTAELDVSILIPAAQAAGLLDHDTVGEPTLRRLRRELVAALASSPVVERALDALDLSASAYTLEGCSLDDQQDLLHQLVGLAGLAELLPAALADRLEGPLMQAEGATMIAPDGVAALAPLAAWLADQLDLDDEHRVNLLLSAFEEAAMAGDVVLDEPALARGMAAAAASFRRTQLSAWLDKLAQISPWIADRFRQEQPLVAQCSDGQSRAQASPVRVRIAATADEEVYLTSHGGQLFLEWDGPAERAPDRATLEPSGAQLQPEQELFAAGTLLWSLGWPPPRAQSCVALHRGDERREVPLAPE